MLQCCAVSAALDLLFRCGLTGVCMEKVNTYQQPAAAEADLLTKEASRQVPQPRALSFSNTTSGVSDASPLHGTIVC